IGLSSRCPGGKCPRMRGTSAGAAPERPGDDHAGRVVGARWEADGRGEVWHVTTSSADLDQEGELNEDRASYMTRAREPATVRVLAVNGCRLVPKATKSAPATSWNSRTLPARLARCHCLGLVTNQLLYQLS